MRKVPALLIMTALLIGCTQRVIEYRADPESGVSVSKLSQDEYWKRQVDDHIKAEVAGQQPEAGYETWREYYEWWSGVLRRKSKPTWKSREFKTSEDLVNYIKEKRRVKGLRGYE